MNTQKKPYRIDCLDGLQKALETPSKLGLPRLHSPLPHCIGFYCETIRPCTINSRDTLLATATQHGSSQYINALAAS